MQTRIQSLNPNGGPVCFKCNITQDASMTVERCSYCPKWVCEDCECGCFAHPTSGQAVAAALSSLETFLPAFPLDTMMVADENGTFYGSAGDTSWLRATPQYEATDMRECLTADLMEKYQKFTKVALKRGHASFKTETFAVSLKRMSVQANAGDRNFTVAVFYSASVPQAVFRWNVANALAAVQ